MNTRQVVGRARNDHISGRKAELNHHGVERVITVVFPGVSRCDSGDKGVILSIRWQVNIPIVVVSRGLGGFPVGLAANYTEVLDEALRTVERQCHFPS